MDSVLGFMLYFTGFVFRWFRELQDRAVMVKVWESQARLASVREAQRSRRRRKTSSAAEELIEMLDRCRTAVCEQKANIANNPRKFTHAKSLLEEADILITDSIRKLAMGPDALPEMRKQKSAATTEETEDSLAEAAFVDMYRSRKGLFGAVAVEEDAIRNARARKASVVRFQASTSQTGKTGAANENAATVVETLRIDGIDIPVGTIVRYLIDSQQQYRNWIPSLGQLVVTWDSEF